MTEGEDELAALDLLTKGWAGLLAGHGLELIQRALPAYLVRQRWFGAKSRTIASVTIENWAELPAPSSHSEGVGNNDVIDPSKLSFGTALTLCGALFFLKVSYTSSRQAGAPQPEDFDLYQLPLAFTIGAEAEKIHAKSPASTLLNLAAPSDPSILHDATSREDFRQSLLNLITNSQIEALGSDHLETGGPSAPTELHLRHHEVFPTPKTPTTQHGIIVGYHTSALTSPSVTSSRVGSAEQSNTSIIFGKQNILKLFRRLQPGENPDTEIGRFLTETAHFTRIPRFLGDITLRRLTGESITLGMLQQLVENEGDGWQQTLDELTLFYESSAIQLSHPPPAFTRPTLTDRPAQNKQSRDHVGPYLEAANILGRRTAEMHLALATPTDDFAFRAEPSTAADLERDARSLDAQINKTLDALELGMAKLEDLVAYDAALVLTRRTELFARSRAITAISPELSGPRIRIHGDYHLGQILRSKGYVVILDFEGEPARSVEERRAKQSPLRDVAGMLRSFSYAAAAGLEAYNQRHPPSSRGRRSLDPWACLWQNIVSTEFLYAWQDTIQANPELLPDAAQAQRLLNAYLLEKALYELLYDLNHRPTWVPIPLSGILALSE